MVDLNMSFRRRRIRSLISPAQKNYFQTIANGVAAATVAEYEIVRATGAPDGIAQVDFPARVKMIYLDITMVSESAAPVVLPEAVIIIRKNEGNLYGVPAVASLTGIGNSAFASKVFFTMQGVPGTQEGFQLRYRGWIRVPPRLQVFNEGDTMEIETTMTQVLRTDCILCIYKWRQ